MALIRRPVVWFRRLLGMAGAFLLSLSGQEVNASDAMTDGAASKGPTDPPKLPSLSPESPAPIILAQHANSGPTTHSNVPGHANFTKRFENPATKLNPAQVRSIQESLKVKQSGFGAAASHVNSGPTTHSNVPGHANFTRTFQDKAVKLNPAQVEGLKGNFQGIGGTASHANSGPTTHSNVPGHANFTEKGRMDTLTRPGAKPGGAASHANSGPTTHSNVPGHANFTDKSRMETLTRPGMKPGGAASHANSGPTTHSNVPGHANFTDKGRVDQIKQPSVNPGGAASHANSGPTTHANVPGHANFADKTLKTPTRQQR